MAKSQSVLDIIIKTVKAGTGDVTAVKGLVNLKNFSGAAGLAFGMLAGAAYTVDKALQATAGAMVAYADKVRDVQFMTGATAEESSRLIQVADDMKISYESLSKIMTAAVRNGIEPNIESIASLSDAYLALAPGAERGKFLLDNFGKSGGEMAELLSQGRAAILDMAASIDDGLILDQAAIDSAREYEKAVDALGEKWEAVSIKIGTHTVPTLTKLADQASVAIDGWEQFFAFIEHQDAINKIAKDMAQANGEIEMWRQYVEEATVQYRTTRAAEAELAEETANLTDKNRELADSFEKINYSNLLGLTMDLQDGYDRFADKEAEIVTRQGELNAAFEAGTISAKEYDASMAELSVELASNAAEMEEWSKKIVFSLVQARLAASDGGIDANEFAFIVSLGEQMGLVDQKTAAMAQNLNQQMGEIDISKPEEFANIWRDVMDLPSSKTFVITTVEQTVTTTDSGGVDYYDSFCFLAGTKITLHNGDTREIQDVRPNDLVLCYEPVSMDYDHARVDKVFKHDAKWYLTLHMGSGDLRVTSEHPLYMRRGSEGWRWVNAGGLEVGDELWTLNGAARIEGIAVIGEAMTVYNLEVGHSAHTYFADGVLAHNKATGGVVHAPGDGLQDTVMVPLANGEGVINAQAMAQPGMSDLLNAINAGRFGGGGGAGGGMVIYGGLTVIAQGSVGDVLGELTEM